MEALLRKRDEALQQVRRKIEESLDSARRGALLDGDAVMRELRDLSGSRRGHAEPNVKRR
jgi:hypothetical protein